MLIRLMLRTALVAALKNKTTVGGRVFDSSMTTLSFGANGQVTTDENEGPFIAVYTGEGAMDSIAGHPSKLRMGASRCEVLIQYGVTQKMVLSDGETDEDTLIGFGFRPLDEALQMALDMTGREIFNELTTPTSDWSGLLHRMIAKISEPRLEAGVSNEDGVRLAAHQLSYLADLVNEPADLSTGSIGRAYLDLLEASDEPLHAEQATFIEGLLSGDVSEAEKARRALGQSFATWLSVGQGPLVDNAEPLSEASLHVEGRAGQAVN